MVNMDFIPSTPCLLNAGTKTQQLSSCFILDIEDSIEGIMNTLAECAKIFQKSGGAGFNISKLRPYGSPLNNSGGIASGPISFMRLFNQLVEEVKHGNSRKGALKIDLNCEHPDIFEFIHCKDDTTQLQNMNISVAITDEFMNAVLEDKDWNLKFNGKIYKTIKAKELWNEIITSAWKTGEPGLSFIDVMNKGNMNPHLGKITGTNPCNEFVNIPYSSCNLASINLLNCVEDKNLVFNWFKLERLVKLGVRFIDDMINVNKLPLPKIQEITEKIRPIGLGTMGLADTLFALHIPMNSEAGIKFIDDLYSKIYSIAVNESQKLAKERGVYPAWKGSLWEANNLPIRNSSLISIAPNGSIGFIAGVNGGIEPVYALTYVRKTQNGDKYIVVNKILKKQLEGLGLYNDNILQKIVDNNGSVKGLKEIPRHIQEIFVTAMDMTPMEHLRCLNAVSKYVDLSVSKTINLPNHATIEDVAQIYIEAWKTGNIKGITVYRDGSRKNQILSTKFTETKPKNKLGRGDIIKAPIAAPGGTYKFVSGCGNAYLTVSYDENGNIVQTFTNKGSSGVCKSNQEAVSRLISLALRGGINIDDVIDQLQSVDSCVSYCVARAKGKKVSKGTSCPSAIAYILNKAKKQEFKEKGAEEQKKNICPECGEILTNESGCISCQSCGFSKCN